MEPTQVLKVIGYFERHWDSKEKFLAQISKDGRICIPKLTGDLLKATLDEEILGAIITVILSPFNAEDKTETEDY